MNRFWIAAITLVSLPLLRVPEGFPQSEATSFPVTHVHPGFSNWADGVVRLSPGRVVFAERGRGANSDDDFNVPCSEVLDVGTTSGDASDRHHRLFHIKLRSKNYNFDVLKTDYEELRRAYLTVACAP
jgi:hypothetical protein